MCGLVGSGRVCPFCLPIGVEAWAATCTPGCGLHAVVLFGNNRKS